MSDRDSTRAAPMGGPLGTNTTTTGSTVEPRLGTAHPGTGMGTGMGGGERHTLACLFATRDGAERAAQDVIAAGIPRGSVELVDQSASSSSASTGSEETGGFWDSLKRMFGGEEDSSGYAEGVRRGQTLLVVRDLDASHSATAAAAIERHDPIDMDEQEAGWRAGGWGSGLASGAAGGAARASAYAGYTGSPHETADLPAASPAAESAQTGKPAARTAASREAELAARGEANAAVAHADRSIHEASGLAQPTETEAATGTGAGATARNVGYGTAPGVTARTTTGTTGMATGTTAVPSATGEGEVLREVEERVVVGKRTVGAGRVRLHTVVTETPVEQDVRLREERVEVERRPVDRALEPGDDAFRERNMEVDATREEAIVGKTARVVGEVGIRKESGERVEHISETERRTEVQVEEDRTADPALGTGTTTPRPKTTR